VRAALLELRRLTALAAPIVLAQVGNMMLGVVDTLMLGRVSREALDAAALGNLWAMGTVVVGLGVVLGVDPLIAQAHGAGDGRAVGLVTQRGLVVASLVAVPVVALWTCTGAGLTLLGQEPALAAEAQVYVTAQLHGAPAYLIFAVLRAYLQGRGITRPMVVVVLAANVVNALADWVLIFGALGARRLGVFGAGLATGTTRVFMVAGLAWLIVRQKLYRGAWTPWSRAALDRAGLASVARGGLGIGVQLGLEVWAFQAAMLLAGRLGEAPLAAYAVVINLASFSFMVPLGVSMAAVTRVGNLIGAGDPRGAQRAAWVALGLGAGVMLVSALAFVALRDELAGLYQVDAEVRALVAASLPVAAAFQVFDGTQVVGCGVLRGIGRTRPAAVFNLIGYYALGLPLGWWLAFERGLGVSGLWWGLSAGLGAVALALVAWIGVRGPKTAAYRAPA